MTDERMALAELLENGSDSDLLREMIGYVAQRLMQRDVEGLVGATADEIAARYAEWEITGPRRGTAANRWVLQSGAGEGRVLVRQVVPQVPEPLG